MPHFADSAGMMIACRINTLLDMCWKKSARIIVAER
jgi:hypothetical protein